MTVSFGQGGYVGSSMSVRATEAYGDGQKPLSKFNSTDAKTVSRLAGERVGPVTVVELKGMLDEIGPSSWHHTSKYANETFFYSIVSVFFPDGVDDPDFVIDDLPELIDDAVRADFAQRLAEFRINRKTIMIQPPETEPQAPQVLFRHLPNRIAKKLLIFPNGRNVGKSIEIEGQSYRLDAVFYSPRCAPYGLAVYFTRGRSLVRIATYWSRSEGHKRSKKLNTSEIRNHLGVDWCVNNDPQEPLLTSTYLSGDFTHKLLAGITGKASINRVTDTLA